MPPRIPVAVRIARTEAVLAEEDSRLGEYCREKIRLSAAHQVSAKDLYELTQKTIDEFQITERGALEALSGLYKKEVQQTLPGGSGAENEKGHGAGKDVADTGEASAPVPSNRILVAYYRKLLGVVLQALEEEERERRRRKAAKQQVATGRGAEGGSVLLAASGNEQAGIGLFSVPREQRGGSSSSTAAAPIVANPLATRPGVSTGASVWTKKSNADKLRVKAPFLSGPLAPASRASSESPMMKRLASPKLIGNAAEGLGRGLTPSWRGEPDWLANPSGRRPSKLVETEEEMEQEALAEFDLLADALSREAAHRISGHGVLEEAIAGGRREQSFSTVPASPPVHTLYGLATPDDQQMKPASAEELRRALEKAVQQNNSLQTRLTRTEKELHQAIERTSSDERAREDNLAQKLVEALQKEVAKIAAAQRGGNALAEDFANAAVAESGDDIHADVLDPRTTTSAADGGAQRGDAIAASASPNNSHPQSAETFASGDSGGRGQIPSGSTAVSGEMDSVAATFGLGLAESGEQIIRLRSGHPLRSETALQKRILKRRRRLSQSILPIQIRVTRQWSWGRVSQVLAKTGPRPQFASSSTTEAAAPTADDRTGISPMSRGYFVHYPESSRTDRGVQFAQRGDAGADMDLWNDNPEVVKMDAFSCDSSASSAASGSASSSVRERIDLTAAGRGSHPLPRSKYVSHSLLRKKYSKDGKNLAARSASWHQDDARMNLLTTGTGSSRSNSKSPHDVAGAIVAPCTDKVLDTLHDLRVLMEPMLRRNPSLGAQEASGGWNPEEEGIQALAASSDNPSALRSSIFSSEFPTHGVEGNSRVATSSLWLKSDAQALADSELGYERELQKQKEALKRKWLSKSVGDWPGALDRGPACSTRVEPSLADPAPKAPIERRTPALSDRGDQFLFATASCEAAARDQSQQENHADRSGLDEVTQQSFEADESFARSAAPRETPSEEPSQSCDAGREEIDLVGAGNIGPSAALPSEVKSLKHEIAAQSQRLAQTLKRNEFVTEQVQEIAKHAIHQTLGNSVYNKEKVNAWCGQIVDACLKELAKLNKPFKYVVTCVIMQKNGSPLHTAATAFWDTKTDGTV
eukprot:g4588.t1